MSTKTNKSVKTAKIANVNTPAAVAPPVQNVQTDKINLADLTARLAGVSVKEKNSLTRKGLYKYSPEEIIEIEKDKDFSKKIRNKARRSTDNFLFEIGLKIKNANIADATTVGKKFVEYYKERFLLNDFSLDSVRESSSLSETEKAVYSVALEFCSTL